MQGSMLRRGLLVCLFLFWGGAMPAFATDTMAPAGNDGETETVVMVGNISYVSGGIGEGSRERLKAFAAAFNLKLVLAMKTGEYIGDVPVSIADKSGKELVKAVSEGPFFMANLPAGSYIVTASAEGKEVRQTVTVAKGKLSTLHFRW